jgi:hypothetical protein
MQTGARNLCFTTPTRIALRSALLPMMYILLGIYFLMTTCMLAQAVFLWCCFRKWVASRAVLLALAAAVCQHVGAQRRSDTARDFALRCAWRGGGLFPLLLPRGVLLRLDPFRPLARDVCTLQNHWPRLVETGQVRALLRLLRAPPAAHHLGCQRGLHDSRHLLRRAVL